MFVYKIIEKAARQACTPLCGLNHSFMTLSFTYLGEIKFVDVPDLVNILLNGSVR